MQFVRQGVAVLAVCGGLILGISPVQAQRSGADVFREVHAEQGMPPVPAAVDNDDPAPEPVTAPVEVNDDDVVMPSPPPSAVLSHRLSESTLSSMTETVMSNGSNWLSTLWQHPVLPSVLIPMGLFFLAVVTGAVVAAFAGVVMVGRWRRTDRTQRQQAAAAVLATELEIRRQAFDVVPMPPGAEAGMSFVSSVMALSRTEPGYHAAIGNLHLLPPRLAASVTMHYAAVQRTAAFTHSQSLAAGLRMLQANRIGGNPCPDANTMRAIHQELEMAFQGIDKIIQSLKAIARI